MVYFGLRFVFLVGFFVLLAKQEFALRRKQKLPVATFKEFMHASSRWAQKRITPLSSLVFAAAAYVCFALWESMILSAFAVFSWTLWLAVPGFIFLAFFLKNKTSRSEWVRKDVAILVVSLGFFLGIVFCWVLTPWVYWRSFYLGPLKNSQNSNKI